jgi:superfamily II RNA helicase
MSYIYISKSQQFQKGIITKLGYSGCYNCRSINHSTSNPDFNLHKVFKINSNNHELAYSIEQHFHKYCSYAKYPGIRGLCEEWYLASENEIEQELKCIFDSFKKTYEFSTEAVEIKDSYDHKNCEGDVRQNSLPQILMDDIKLPFELNKFQKAAISKFNNNNALFVMATGSGKTLAALVCCTRWIRNNPGKKILWISRFLKDL